MSETGPLDTFQFDYRRYTAALDLKPEHQNDFQRLLKSLRFATRFQLLFARIGTTPYRDALLGKLDEMLTETGRTVHRLDLSDRRTFPDFAALEAVLNGIGRDAAIIHLLNGDAWLQNKNLVALNVRRNALAEHLDAALLWWLYLDGIDRVARLAPDAWSWRNGVFDFDDSAALQFAASLAKETTTSAPPSGLTLAQRSQRLAVLRQQLTQEMPDDFRMGLLVEQADLLNSLGLLDEAEQVLREQALPLAEKLGDARSKANTQSRLADILCAHGELDQALYRHTHEALPIYERLGDVRGKAITQGKIADILFVRGELDQALALHQQRLPAFERLGDIRSKAVTQGNIADIYFARGEFDQALRIRTHDELPIYEHLGDVRSTALTQGKIADIHFARGEFDQALRIITHDEFPIYERLGDIRSTALTQCKIAGILFARGDLDQALALYLQWLPVAEKMNDIASIANIRYSLAAVRLQRGDHKRGGIQAIYDDLAAAYAISRRLGRPDFIGGIGVLLAQVLAMRGQRDEALQMLDQAEAAFVKLGREAGVTQVRQLRAMISA